MNNYLNRRWPLALVMSGTLIVTLQAQNKESAKDFEKKVSSNVPLFVDGERVYRGTEVTKRALVTFKPEPMFTEKGTEEEG